QINAGVFEGEGQVIRADILKALPTIRAGVAYFDPPYPGTVAHEREYRVLDEIIEGASLPVSDVSAKDGISMVDELLKRAAHIPVWVLSFGNAVTEIEALEAKMKARGRCTRAVAVHYMHKESVASEVKKALNQEFVVVGWDPEAALPRRDLLQGVGVRDDFHQADIPGAVAGVKMDPDDLGSQGATPRALPGDSCEEGEPPLPKEIVAGWRHALPELQARIDVPDPVLGEPGLDGDGEWN